MVTTKTVTRPAPMFQSFLQLKPEILCSTQEMSIALQGSGSVGGGGGGLPPQTTCGPLPKWFPHNASEVQRGAAQPGGALVPLLSHLAGVIALVTVPGEHIPPEPQLLVQYCVAFLAIVHVFVNLVGSGIITINSTLPTCFCISNIL
ncbi:hypothetical protein E2C01_022573 [Portunus trituberculatus]|uniref:Uncharacterized protein n=1 Tax=Portunus trituberculatus TaxID=210409 RepID=A0A5B7E802_PORTR|nr:hypothetical protein [Portunus trituberculatus]